jgi:DNA-binding transcriptional ArsR family regulator
MDKQAFARIAESLRQYRRADLRDFEEVGANPVDSTYVDPLPDDAVLRLTLASNTTFLLGRKGTGKSTVFARAQSEIRRGLQSISVYVDVKSLYNLLAAEDPGVSALGDGQVHPAILAAHRLRKAFLGAVLADLLREVRDSFDRLSLYDRWVGRRREYADVKRDLERLQEEVRKGKTSEEELPILRLISTKTKDRSQKKEQQSEGGDIGGRLSPTAAAVSAQVKDSSFEETLTDNEVYKVYSDAVLRSFPYAEIVRQVRDLLEEIGMKRLIVFFDDFSELSWLNQRLFVDVVLAPLNNASEENIKLKVAAYPGRVYYGTIDPGKIDTLNLDFYVLYKSHDLQGTEAAAIDYTTRLLNQRFESFGVRLEDYLDANTSVDDFMRLMFEATFNVPRLMGYILHYCYLDRISQGISISLPAVRLAAQKYYDQVLSRYFDRMNRFALEPFDRKLDRKNQFDLLRALIDEAKSVRRKIQTGEVGGDYFKGLKNPPVSHFAISPELEHLLASLEMNFLVSKYHTLRDKDKKEVGIFAFHYGLAESERLGWGYPRERRLDRNYFIQRCFNFNTVIHQFLAKRQTIRCNECHVTFGLDEQKSLERYDWLCPECRVGKCEIVKLSEGVEADLGALDQTIMLEPVELEILSTLDEEARPMRAGEIATLIDVEYQLVGRRTSKLREGGFVKKEEVAGHMRSSITPKAEAVYFDRAAKTSAEEESDAAE